MTNSAVIDASGCDISEAMARTKTHKAFRLSEDCIDFLSSEAGRCNCSEASIVESALRFYQRIGEQFEGLDGIDDKLSKILEQLERIRP